MVHHTHVHDSAPETQGRTIRWARFYDPLVRVMLLGRDRRLRRRTLDLARLVPGETVLDVGCGTGDLSLRAQRRVGASGKIYGIDAAPEMIAVARRKATRSGSAADFRVAVIEQLPFADRSVDVVLSSLMMHHLPDDVKRRGLAEIRRVLRPGGRLVVVDFKHPTTAASHIMTALVLHGRLSDGVRELPSLLAASGFEQIEQHETNLSLIGGVSARVGAV